MSQDVAEAARAFLVWFDRLDTPSLGVEGDVLAIALGAALDEADLLTESTPAAPDEEGLDAAWAAAVAALPEGWAINLLWATVTEDAWGASAGPWPARPSDLHVFGGGPTPSAALQELAARLRQDKA